MKQRIRGKKTEFIRNYDAEIIKQFLTRKGISCQALSRLIGRSDGYCGQILRLEEPLHNQLADALEVLGLPRDKYINEPTAASLPTELTLLPTDEQTAGGAVNNQNTDLYEIIKKAMYDALAAYFGKEQ